ncbi:ankyrin repeat-containing domain protein [Russula emetica]|nr:ankyrin repeat-containing domain protein [Russula emetica]
MRNSSSIIQEVNRTRNKSDIIAFYYFDSKNPKKRDLWGFLASLVTQLYESSKRHPKSMPTLYTKCRNSSDPPSEAELKQLLNDFLAELKAQSSIFIVIDGVDHCMETECTESPRKKVLKFLEDLVRAKHSKLYICITSSLMEDMEKSLKQMAAGASSRQVMLHDEVGQKKDIKTYIAAFVRDHMQTLPDKDKDDLIKMLSEQAGGRFGWISHRLNALVGNIPSRTSDILEEVGNPRDEEFAQALHDIPEEKSQYAVRLFRCLVAAIRPLSLKELADIFTELDSNAEPHEDAVLSACPALITHNKDDPTIIQFSHGSVKDFLTSNPRRTSSIENNSGYHFSLKAAHATLARVCINVLLRFDETADKTHLKESPLALYAAQYWVQHTQEGNAATENQGVMESLFDPSKSHFDAWIWMHDADKGQSRKARNMENLEERPSRRSATPLYYAALCGFTELVEHLASLLREDHNTHGYHGTPLHAASYKGHDGAVLALLSSDPGMMDEKADSNTPLHAAYYGEQLNTMNLLLDKGADVNATGDSDNTLLHCASLHGRLDVVELLLKYEAKVNAKNKNGWTPLHRAALRGQVKVAEHLLNFNLKDENDKNPKVLVEIDAQSYDKNTPLHVASIAGKLQIVELLLRHNADKEIKGEYGWTPREAANKHRHEKIVERLARSEPSWWGGGELRRARRGAHRPVVRVRPYNCTVM